MPSKPTSTDKLEDRIDITPQDVKRFIDTHDDLYKGRLKIELNYPRVVLLAWLKAYLDRTTNAFDWVGVVSGSEQDPELPLLQRQRLTVLNFDGSPTYDLDTDWTVSGVAAKHQFNFTLCSQVLEHVADARQAFANLVACTAPGGLILVSIPVVNRIHGEPYFYSSGFHPRYLLRLGREQGLEVKGYGQFGTAKYMMTCMAGKWLSYQQLAPGIHTSRDIVFPLFMFNDGRKENSRLERLLGFKQVMTDCWAVFRKSPVM